MIIPFSKLGCSSEINLLPNDNYVGRRENDLTGYGTDLHEITPIQILNEDKVVSIFIKNKKVLVSLTMIQWMK